jgi:FOG: Ankyrin repeat
MIGNLAFAEELVKRGADLRSQDESGMTALHVAMDLGQTNMARFLLDVPAPPPAGAGRLARASALRAVARRSLPNLSRALRWTVV